MYIVVAEHIVTPEIRAAFLAALIDDARDAVQQQPGSLRFDIIEDPTTPNRILNYLVCTDRAAFAVHRDGPIGRRFHALTDDWRGTALLTNIVFRGNSIFPPDDAIWHS